jgi:hypothetical protein
LIDINAAVKFIKIDSESVRSVFQFVNFLAHEIENQQRISSVIIPLIIEIDNYTGRVGIEIHDFCSIATRSPLCENAHGECSEKQYG